MSAAAWSGRDSLLLLCRSHPHVFPAPAAAIIAGTCKELASCLAHPLSSLFLDSNRRQRTNCTPLAAVSHNLDHLIRPALSTSHRPDLVASIGFPAASVGIGQGPSCQLASIGRLQLMVNSGSPPSPQECNRMLIGSAASSRWEDVWRCYQALQALGINIEVETYDVLWKAAVKACYVSQGVELFQAMIAAKGFACQRSYVTIISRLLKIKRRGLANRSLAYQLWRELGASGQKLDAASLRTGLNACVETGRIQEAQRLMERMREARIKAGHGAYNILLKYHCRRGQMQNALKVFKEMRVMGYTPDIITFNTLASGYAEQGDVPRARAVIDKALREGCKPDVITYSPYLLALARRGEAAAAHSAVEEMWSRGIRPNAWSYAALVEAYIKAGDLPGAENAAKEMRWRCTVPHSPVVYNLLLQAHLRQGHAGEARADALLKEMQQQGMTLDVDTYCLLMNAAASSGESRAEQRVLGFLQQMRAEGLAPDAVQLSTVSKAFERAGHGREAMERAVQLQACPNSEQDLIACNQLVHLHCGNDEMEAAEQAAQHAASIAAADGLPPPVEAFGALIRAYYRKRQLGPLLVAFRKFLRMGGRPNRKMANAVVRLTLVNGDLSTALQAIRAMKLLGVDMDTDQYKSWVMQVQRRQKSTNAESSSDVAEMAACGAFGASLERLKWFLGLPNEYYRSDWRE